MHGLVVPEAVRQRDDNPLQHTVLPRQGAGGDARLIAVQQDCASPDRRVGRPAAQGRGGEFHAGVVARALPAGAGSAGRGVKQESTQIWGRQMGVSRPPGPPRRRAG